MFDHRQFSRLMKVALGNYHAGVIVDIEELEKQFAALSKFDLSSLIDDDLRKTFWINIYNGLTNYFIIRHGLKNSVWEVENFFSALRVSIGGTHFSLDDIEHGILRKNGERKKGKSRQFETGNPKLKLMVKEFDPRIHFALNCGSISCPPIAFYSAENIGKELNLAEESFALQEFKIIPDKLEIHCSEIFIWYQMDFPDTYLNSPDLKGFAVKPIPYQWTIH
ncbi:MAG: DUF547 domain-containing protein [Roseivirga sp.]|nr:DUF547 domain-containing protein [Roseivirga sp.]